jgi:hypothetical protein
VDIWRFLYLFLGLYYCAGLGLMLLIRPDVTRPAIIGGLCGAGWEMLSEVWYLHDYWRPENVLGLVWPGLEDAIYGFGVTGVTICSVPVLAKLLWRRDTVSWVHTQHRPPWVLGLLYGLYAAVMMLAVYVAQAPSMVTVCCVFAVVALVPCLYSARLAVLALVAAVFMALVSFLSFWFALNVVIDGPLYLAHVLLRPTATVAGVPTIQIVWDFLRAPAVICLMTVLGGWSLTVTPARTRAAV